MSIKQFTSGPKSAVRNLNDIVRVVNSLNNFIGDGLILVNRTNSGYVIGLNIDALKGRLAMTHAVGKTIYKAYCKTDAGAATTIVCYLDTDSTGDEVTVNCSICGGGTLNSASPRLSDGDLIFVTQIDGSWHCLTNFQATEECECL